MLLTDHPLAIPLGIVNSNSSAIIACQSSTFVYSYSPSYWQLPVAFFYYI